MISFFLTANRLLKAFIKAIQQPIFKSLIVTLVLIILSGTLFYSKIEGWAYIDAVYFAVVSLIPSSIEIGLSPVTTTGKIFTMMYLIVGVGVMIGLIGIIGKAVLDVGFKNSSEKDARSAHHK
jgi:hypothetical protein